MGEKYELAVKSRSKANGKPKAMRRDGLIPGVIYGKKAEAKSVKVDQAEFEKVFEKAGESMLIDLSIDDGKPFKVLVYGLQRDPIKNKILNIDFYQVDMKQKIKTEIPLVFTGESRAVNELKGVLVKNFDEIEVECLPSDLVPSIEVDISPLDDFDKAIKVSDIAFPPGLVPQLEENVVIAGVQEPTKEEEIPVEAPEGETEAEVETEEKPGEEKAEETGEEKKE